MEQILKGFYKIKVTDDLDIYDKHTQVKIIKPNQDAVSVIEEFVTQATYKIDRTTLSDNNFQKIRTHFKCDSLQGIRDRHVDFKRVFKMYFEIIYRDKTDGKYKVFPMSYRNDLNRYYDKNLEGLDFIGNVDMYPIRFADDAIEDAVAIVLIPVKEKKNRHGILKKIKILDFKNL